MGENNIKLDVIENSYIKNKHIHVDSSTEQIWNTGQYKRHNWSISKDRKINKEKLKVMPW